ncbi:MAG: glutamyl-tRNA reductase [SAR86 cluster bacterium]|uniref:Glutamyl-tRNA reductase n=1 Tax=SAR86 cluster bacterium TaxID=2030880 RepID=A0A2A4XET4_9GAMM|nr:MAG: glutamyl-tRNA reductase [SAR86 cluster bacterium]
MALVLVGINHNTANIEMREKVAFPPEIVESALAEIHALPPIREVVIVSTCNRTEIYLDFAGDDAEASPGGELAQNRQLVDRQAEVVAWLSKFHDLETSELEQCSYSYASEDVVRHLMKVSCGLDSMVLGEPQILGQIKSAYAVSKDQKVVGQSLGRAFEEAFSIAKQVRTDTAIGENPVSVAYAAVTLAERIFSDLPSLSVLLIGAGRTIELVVKHLVDKGVSEIVVANRTLDNALEIANRFDAHGVLLSDIPEQLINADIVVSSTNSQLPLLGKGAVERALKQRKHKPMLLVDLAVPRDIEAEVSEIADAYLYSIDDISEVIEDGVKSRSDAAAQAESIIERGVEDYRKQLRSLNAVSTLRAFRDKADAIRERELERALKALEKGESADAVVSSLARSLTQKLVHSPSVQMKKASAEGRDELLELTAELFELSSESKPNAGEETDKKK